LHAQLVPVPAGVLVAYQEVYIEEDVFGSQYEAVRRSPVVRYQAEGDSWETLLRDAPIEFAGTPASGYAVGTLDSGGPSDLLASRPPTPVPPPAA